MYQVILVQSVFFKCILIQQGAIYLYVYTVHIHIYIYIHIYTYMRNYMTSTEAMANPNPTVPKHKAIRSWRATACVSSCRLCFCTVAATAAPTSSAAGVVGWAGILWCDCVRTLVHAHQDISIARLLVEPFSGWLTWGPRKWGPILVLLSADLPGLPHFLRSSKLFCFPI